MTDLSAQATNFRTQPYKFNGYLSILIGETVMTGAVSANASEPFTTLSYTVSTGSDTNVKENFEVIVTDSGGTFKGRLRVAEGGTISSTSLPVNETSKGRLNVVSGDLLTVNREVRLRDKLVAQSATFDKDSRISYSAQTSNPEPLAASGGHWAGWVDSGMGFATITLDGSDSALVDPDSGSPVTHSWTLPSGVAFASGSVSTDQSPTIEANAASTAYLIQHDVTDPDNSQTATQWVYVRVHNDANPPTRVLFTSLEADLEAGGWRTEFELPLGADTDALPDGAMVIYWEDEYRNGTKNSYGNAISGRSHIKFTGFVVRDTIEVDPDTDTVRFETVGPMGILEQLPAFSQALKDDSTPANWQEMKTLTLHRVFIYLLRYGTTFLQLFDLILSSNNPTYDDLFIQELTPLEQLRELVRAVQGVITCDRAGRMYIRKHLHKTSSANRDAATTTYTLTSADVRRVTAIREHRFKLAQLEGRAFTEGGVPILSVAPGEAPAEGPGRSVVERMIVSSQSDLNDVTGWEYALQNALDNGIPAPQGVDIELHGGYDAFDIAYEEWLKLTLAASTNSRGIAWSDDRFTVSAITIQAEGQGAKTVTLTLNHETDGQAGTTVIPPQETQSGLGDFTLPDFGFSLPDFTFINPLPDPSPTAGNIAIFVKDNNFYTTADLSTPAASGGPSWTAFDLSTDINWAGSETVQCFLVDPFSSQYLGTGSTVDGWIFTDANMYKISDIFGSWSLSVPASLGVVNIGTKISAHTERGQQNRIGVAYWDNAAGVKVRYSTDGTTLNTPSVSVGTGYDTATGKISEPGFYVDPNTGKMYTTAWSHAGGALGASRVPAAYVSSDGGDNWSTTTDFEVSEDIAACIRMPVTRSDVWFHGLSTINGGFDEHYLYRSIGGTKTDISYDDGTGAFGTYGPDDHYRSIAVADDDPNYLVYAGYNNKSGSPKGVLALTRNALSGAAWIAIVGPIASASFPYRGVYIGPEKAIYVVGTSGTIAFADGSQTTPTLDDRSGDLATSSEIIGLCGG